MSTDSIYAIRLFGKYYPGLGDGGTKTYLEDLSPLKVFYEEMCYSNCQQC